jgi:benzoate-CoA ligase
MNESVTVSAPHNTEQMASPEPHRYNAAQDLLERNLAPRQANKVAIVDEAGSYTFAQLAERVHRCANALTAAGLRREERVALILLDTIDFPTCFLGAIEAGIVPIPLSTMLQPADYAHALSDSEACFAIVSDALLPQVQQAVQIARWSRQIVVPGKSVPGFAGLSEMLQSASDVARYAPTNSSDVCFWLYSSGSTGKPKAAVHRQTSMAQTAELFAQGVLGLRETDVVYSAAKLFFAYGLGNALSFPLAVGATAVLYSGRANADAVCEVLRKFRPTIFCGVPTLFAALLACPHLPLRGELNLRLCVSAGEALPEQLGLSWVARTGVEIVDGIGSTEMLHIFISNRPGACHYGTTGRLAPGYKARLLDENGRDIAQGEMGDLLISGPSAAACYWNDPEKTRSTFLGEWVKTGDRFRQNAEGEYLYCGRSDEMLKVGGIWVSPTEVEAALIAHEAVLEAAVVGVADEMDLIKPKAFIVLKRGLAHEPRLAAELKEFIKRRLAPYKCPRWIEFVDELPKTPTGKIRRNVLRQNAAAARPNTLGA